MKCSLRRPESHLVLRVHHMKHSACNIFDPGLVKSNVILAPRLRVPHQHPPANPPLELHSSEQPSLVACWPKEARGEIVPGAHLSHLRVSAGSMIHSSRHVAYLRGDRLGEERLGKNGGC